MLQTSYSFITSKEIPKQKSNWTKKKKKKNQIEVSLLIKYTDYDYKENRHFSGKWWYKWFILHTENIEDLWIHSVLKK